MDYQAGRDCPLCGEEGQPFENDGRGLRFCDGVYNQRGMWHQSVLLSWPWESEEAYHAWYQEGDLYHTVEARSIGADSFWHRDSEYLAANVSRLRFLQSAVYLPPRPYFLDVGAGTGALASLAEATLNATAKGMEPNKGMVAQGSCLGRPVCCGSWTDVINTEWDVITLCDVLEHLTRPYRCLTHLRSRLKENGVLYVEMPEWDGLLTNRHVKPRQHICLYSQGAAEILFARTGFDILAMQRPLHGTIGKIAWILTPTEEQDSE